jgi:hypothetical protein
VRSNQRDNEGRGNAFEVALELKNGNIATQAILVNSLEGSQEIPGICPYPFSSVDMNFSDTIPIIISYPFILAVTNSGMRTNDRIVTG